MRKFQPVRLAGVTVAAATTAAALLTGVSSHATTLNATSSTSDDNISEGGLVPNRSESARTSGPISMTEVRSALQRQLGSSPALIACWSNISIASRANHLRISTELAYDGIPTAFFVPAPR